MVSTDRPQGWLKLYKAFKKKTGTEACFVEKSPHEAGNEREVRAVAGQRQPIQLVIANGKKNLTKKEIAERLDQEVQPCTDDLTAPTYLTSAERTRFTKVANQLTKLGILGETDVETLARYITAQTQYERVTKELRTLMKNRPDPGAEDYLDRLEQWAAAQTALAKLQDRYFKQAQTVATSLGLTISSRCRLVAPKTEEAPKQNKFARFGGETRDA